MSDSIPTNSTSDGGGHNGSGGGIIPFNLPIWMAMAGATGVAWYNVVELNVNIYMTFKKRRGLYFWSLLIASWGVIGHSVSLVFKFWTNYNVYWICTLLMFGWWSMVTGQSFVLYSRLHLVVRDHRILRGVLIMIIIDAICLHIPTSVMTYGSSSDMADLFLGPFSYMEKIQMTLFTIQEAIISGIYVYYTIKLLKPTLEGNRRRTRSVMLSLIWVNVFIIFMDLCILGIEYHGDYAIEAALKSMVYSIKLKLEFAVLNQLMRIAQSSIACARHHYSDGPSGRGGRSGIADDVTLAGPRRQSHGFAQSYARAEGGAIPVRPPITLGETEMAITPLTVEKSRIQVSKDIEVEYSKRDPPANDSPSDTQSDIELRRLERPT